MNILYISNHLNTGGITSYLLTLAAGMRKKGHRVYVASSGGEWLPRFIEEDLNTIPIPIRTKKEISPKILSCFLRLSGIIKKNRIELIHSNSRTTQVLAHLLRRSLGVKHVFTCHGFFKKRLFRRLFPCWPDATIAISESVKGHLVKDFRAEEKNIFVVHNGIDAEKFRVQSSEFRREAKKKYGLGEGPVIGIVARLSDVKGHIYLIQAVSRVLKSFTDVQLLIVGDGKMKNELVRMVGNLGLSRNVIFVPSVQDTREVFSIMDLFVMPSLKEGLGLALMEAMASGLAVVGSDVGGIKGLIQEGVNGLLIKPADVVGLSEGILRLLRNPQDSKFLGEAARVFIQKNFSREKMVFQTEGVYSKCLSDS
jgi:glycosyltransferase involved in cell wall biosynthesis